MRIKQLCRYKQQQTQIHKHDGATFFESLYKCKPNNPIKSMSKHDSLVCLLTCSHLQAFIVHSRFDTCTSPATCNGVVCTERPHTHTDIYQYTLRKRELAKVQGESEYFRRCMFICMSVTVVRADNLIDRQTATTAATPL